MDFSFTTAPANFAATLADSDAPAEVKAALTAVWDATVTNDPLYEVSAAAGELWTVVRVAAVREE